MFYTQGTTMNIHSFIPTLRGNTPLIPDLDAMMKMLEMRRITYSGFAMLEADKGFLTPTISLHTTKGQEALRLLMFRVIEEVIESVMADERAHALEEAIDAINYLWSMLIVDPKIFQERSTASFLALVFTDPIEVMRDSSPGLFSHIHSLTNDHVSHIVQWLAGDVGDLLRNRAWMNNSQSIYFEGSNVLLLSIVRVTRVLYNLFESWDEFAEYYYAKDMVLQFRLRTNY